MGLQTLSSRVNDPQNTFVLTVGMMNGGTQSNIIADEVELVGTTRAFDKAFLNGEGKEEAASPPKKEANPASLRSAAPSKGRGSRGHSLLPLEGGAPKGRRLDGGSGMKESEGDHLKCVVYESTLSTAARSPFPNGEGCDTRMSLSPHRQSECTHMWKKNNNGQSLPRVGKVASGASRIGFWQDEKEGGIISGRRFTKAPSAKTTYKTYL